MGNREKKVNKKALGSMQDDRPYLSASRKAKMQKRGCRYWSRELFLQSNGKVRRRVKLQEACHDPMMSVAGYLRPVPSLHPDHIASFKLPSCLQPYHGPSSLQKCTRGSSSFPQHPLHHLHISYRHAMKQSNLNIQERVAENGVYASSTIPGFPFLLKITRRKPVNLIPKHLYVAPSPSLKVTDLNPNLVRHRS